MSLLLKKQIPLAVWCIACGLMVFATGCNETEDGAVQALKDRGVRVTTNDEGEVEGLYLYSSEDRKFRDQDLAFLKDYPSTTLLLVESRNVTDAALQYIKPLKNLKTLDLTFCRGTSEGGGKVTGGITDAAVAELKTMTQLKRLGLQGTRITDAAVDRLQQELPDCTIDFNYSDGILGAMAQRRRRGETEVDVVTTVQDLGAEVGFDDDLNPIDLKLGVSDLALRYIGKKSTLKSLTLRGNFTGGGLANLTKLTELESLDIADPYGRRTLGKGDVATLVSFTNLKSLDLSGNQIGDDELQMLKMLSGLETLRLVGCPVTDSALEKLKKSLPDCEITYSTDPLLNAILNSGGDVSAAVKEVAEDVKRNEDGKLTHVEFRLSQIGDNGLERLKELPEIESLHFVYCRRITDDGMRFIAEMKNLKDLTLSHTNVGKRGISKLVTLRQLEKLDLTTNRVGSRTNEPLDNLSMRNIAELKQLKSLSLHGVAINDSGLLHLEALEGLESLDLRSTQVSAEGLSRFKKRVPNCDIKI
jgi:Leucine-rich repeat (LRR) protein